MAIENQPAARDEGVFKYALDSVTIDLAFDQGGSAQVLQVHDSGVYAGQNAAKCLANRLLARAFISDHVVRMLHAAFENQTKVIRVGAISLNE